MAMQIVLVEPEIPQNTGNIARTCAATGTALHLVGPLGFSLDSKYLKRAGLDYWNLLELHVYQDMQDFYRQNGMVSAYYTSTKAPRSYCDVSFHDGDWIFFGRETCGLPESLLRKVYDRCIRIPMRAEARSLNLSNSVAIVLFEALRQQGFHGLTQEGCLTGRDERTEPWLDYV